MNLVQNYRKSVHQIFLSLIVLIVVGVYTTHTTYAASFSVACNDVSGLIAAINTANSNGQADTITLAANCTYVLGAVDNNANGPNGLPAILNDGGNPLTINGNGASLTRTSENSLRFFYILAGANLTLQNFSLIGGNPGPNPGGAILNQGTLSLAQVTLEDNAATQGGGIKNDTGATLTIDRSTISGNLAVLAPGKGGAIYSDGTMTLVNSTLSNNTAQDDGAGMEVGASSNTTILNSTIAFNITQGSPGEGGAIFNFSNAPVTVRNSIFANNVGFSGPNCYGPITSQGNNLSNTGECSLNAAGDLLNTDPSLGALADNGGATQTHALTPGSPAIDAGDAGACAAAPVNGIDQRGVVRPQGAGCDIGAYETFLIDFNGLPAQNGVAAKDALNNAYSARGLTFDFSNISGGYPATDGSAVIAATDPGGMDAVVNFAFAADFVRVKYVASSAPEAYLTAYAQPVTPDIIPATNIGVASDLVNPYPKALTVTGACIRAVQLETAGFDFSFDDLEIHPMSGPDTDGDGVVDQCDGDFIVNSNDDGDDGVCDSTHCSLREAILAANARANGATPDEIHFNIPGAGVKTIQPTAALPSIDDPVVIDGSTQPGSNCTVWPPTLQIELSGASAGGSFGLVALIGDNTVRGLVINRFGNAGIYLDGTGNNTIQCNFIGTDATGEIDRGNITGIWVNNTGNNIIGGTTPGQGNLVTANFSDGLWIVGPNANGNIVQGNYIGTNATGTTQVGNTSVGIGLSGSNNLIGGPLPGAGNIIVGTNFYGINIFSASASLNTIQGNYIGTNAAGNVALYNLTNGIVIESGAHDNSITANVIARNNRHGILIQGATSANNVIQNNWIGTDQAGTASLPNSENGILIDAAPGNIIGGMAANESNTIANNGGHGVAIINATATNNRVRGNRIFDNGGLGIDLGADGVTFNHQGTIAGPNNYQNYPVLTLATSQGSGFRYQGTFNGTANTTFDIDLFINPTCDPSAFGEGPEYFLTFPITTDGNGYASFDGNMDRYVPEGQSVSAIATDQTSNNTSEFSYCFPVSTNNLNWETALTLPGTSVQQYITAPYQEKWFKFPVTPGAKVRVTLTGEAGSAVSLHRDPHFFYNELTVPSSAAVLSAQAADTGFLPFQSLPFQSLPFQSLPFQSLPFQSLPTGFLPFQSLPFQSLPFQSLPFQSLPFQSLPFQSLPTGSLPFQSLPFQSLPFQSLPSDSLPAGILPEAYSGAARRSLMSIALDPNATTQTIDLNTYDLLEDLYVRVVGPNNLTAPFTLDVIVDGGVCEALEPIPTNLAVIAGQAPGAGALKTLILTHSGRLPGTPTEIQAALAKLQELANRAGDVDGVVIDLADAKYARVAWAMEQADANVACPTAKNMLATEIKQVIDLYRSANQSTLQYIVLAGNADVIPFFQVQDVSGLANEKEYVVPVKPSTASEAGLKVGLVQGQDGYGSQADLVFGSRTYAVPDLAVGRLVETANDIITVVNAYIATNGVVAPDSALVTGYDFVGDAAEAIRVETDAGTNATSDLLIQAPGLPPSDPSAWSADALRTKLFAGNHDLVVLSGHFSAGDLLAADYRTSISASEVAASAVDLTNVIVFTLGCHGGYTIPSNDLLANASPDPDWAKAFLRKQVAGYVAATGYAYGDTELTEYGERLFVELTRQLRTGTGPIALGQALVAAKQRYLAQTAQITGIDEKTLVEMTLYGLPMMKVNMPGQRITPPTDASIVGTPTAVTTGPGSELGLRVGQPAVIPTFTEETVPLKNLADNSTVNTTYYVGKDGVVVNPYEPILPKELYNVSANAMVLRGVALRSATYVDEPSITPLTSAPATETSQAHPAFKTDKFYPNQVWASNFLAAINGGPERLVAVPAQFKSTTPDATDGILRRFTNLNFNLYYLPSNWIEPISSPNVRAAAVAAAPTILSADAIVTTNSVSFTVEIQGEATAGIQAVWILYTGQSGPLYGQWQPLDLTRTDPALYPTRWSGTLALANGANAQNLQYMVQAVNGAGLASLATNQGAYYTVAPETPPPPAQPTELVIQSAPTSGAYLRDSVFALRLTATGQPLANQLVTLVIGGQGVQTTTDDNGEATLTVQPLLAPGTYATQASFRGNPSYQSSSATSTFTVVKDNTSLTLTSQPGTVTALLRDSANRPLGLRSIVFVISGNGQTVVRSVSSDFWGTASSGALQLPPGTYTVDTYFMGVIPLDNGQTVTINDDYYTASHATGSLTIGSSDTTAPLVTVSFPTPPAAQNGWFNAANAINGIVGSVTANETTTGGSNVTAINCNGATVGILSGVGTIQASGSLTVGNEGSNAVSCTAIDSLNNNGAASGSSNTATVKIDKTAPETQITGQPANPSGASVTFTFTGNDGAGSGIGRLECRLDTGSFAVCTSPQIYSLAGGSHTFAVRAIDAAGNIDATPASYTWTVQVNPNTLVGSCGGYDVYRTPQGQYVAAGWTGTIKVGTTGNNTLNGTSGRDLMLGLAGNDTLQGQGGNDVLCGGDGTDLVQGFAGNDYLDGGAGTDILNGGAGDHDQLYGGDGNDVLLDGDGVLVAYGGAGSDLFTLVLRRGWRNLNNQARFEGLAAGYGNDIVGIAILDSTQFYVSLTGDERDNPPSPLEGNQDKLGLVGRIAATSEIIKFEQRAITGVRSDIPVISDDAGAEYLPTEEENRVPESAANQIFLPLVAN